MAGSTEHARPLHFRPRHRLTHARQFQSVYGCRVRKSRGPLTVFARPNELSHPRLGLSVGRRVGGAVVRNNVKRLLREAFRHLQHEVPVGYDLVISVSPHKPLTLDAYAELLEGCWRDLHRQWEKRAARERAEAQKSEPGS